jgi:hypothetical protein
MIKEKIYLIGNLNTIDLKQFKKEYPLSYAYLCLENHLNNSGLTLIFINQDINRVYFKIRNNINNKTSYIMDLSNSDLLNMDIFTAYKLKEDIWNL